MKIVHATFSLDIGGTETMLVNIANMQQAKGHQVHIMVINDFVAQSIVNAINPGIKIHYIGRPMYSKNPKYLLRVNLILMRVNPDVIHIHHANEQKFILLPHLRHRMCITMHALVNDTNSKHIDRCGPIFAISDMVRSQLKEKLGLESTTVNNGVRTDSIRHLPASERKPYDGKRTFRIVQISRLETYKAQDLLLEALSLLRARGIKNVSVTLMGEGPFRQTITDMISRLNLADCVEMMGNVSQQEIFDHLCEYDLLVQPSRFEGFGLTVAEALAAEVPALVSSGLPPMKIIEDGRYGFSFTNDDPEDCSRMIEHIMLNPPTAGFLDAARRHVVDNYSVGTTAQKYLELYQEKVLKH